MRNPRSKDEASRSKKRLHVEERNSRANPKRSVTPSKVEVLKSEIAHCPRIPATVEVAFFWFAHCPRIPLPLHSRKLLVFGSLQSQQEPWKGHLHQWPCFGVISSAGKNVSRLSHGSLRQMIQHFWISLRKN
ncbi:uncharacterized protein LOC116204573 isoform X2 [Punica granatum]|uniref:Uncharacterized protein LOC116204573 isoform X2 n=1 Tax=Punica granatum TaxID=22663 RepID=A0A6P8DLL7_PUNGR|nr:uncharacterized protein LOC116204573 isoform X2 [Punica granatum]